MKRIAMTLLLWALPLAAFAQSSFSGNWKVDLNKVQLDEKPSVYLLKDGVYTCESCIPKQIVKADGEYHSVAGSPYSDELRVKVVDANTVDITGRKQGKTSFHELDKVSNDGMTLTMEYEGHPESSSQPIEFKGTSTRVGSPEGGAHLFSGSWKMEKYSSVSENVLRFQYASTPDGMEYKASTGESYSAKFDGKDYPFLGDPGTTSVALRRVNERSFEETYKRKDEVINRAEITLSEDGTTLDIVSHDTRRGSTDHFVAQREGNPEMSEK